MSNLNFVLIVFISILLLLANTILKYTNSALWITITIVLLLVILIPNLFLLLRFNRTSKVIIFQIIITICFLLKKENVTILSFLNSALKFSDVIVFLIFMPIYTLIFKYCRLDLIFISMLYKTKANFRKPMLLFTAIISSISLSFGTNLVYGSAMPKKDQISASTLSRGIIISMMLLPTTGSTATVMLVFSDIPLMKIIITMLPIAIAAFFLAWIEGGRNLTILETHKPSDSSSINWIPAVSAIIILALLIALGLPILLAMSWSALLSFLLFFRNIKLIEDLGGNLKRTTQQLTPEILLFIITGILIWSMSNTLNISTYFSIPKQFQIYIIPLAILVLMSVTSIIGLHPIAIFGLSYSTIHSLSDYIPDHIMYCVWIIGFGCSLLLSPVSVLTATSVYASGLSIEKNCYFLHWKYVLMLIIITIFYITSMNIIFF